MTPTGISKLHAADRKHSFIIYLDIPIEVRKARLSERNDNSDSIDRRLAADEKDFENFTEYDIKLTDHNF